MKKLNIKDFVYVNTLIILFLVFLLIFHLNNPDCYYGSTTDWLTQHVTIPEYLRNLFYQTKQLLPNFAPHLGGGVNIYYLSYYGLFSPIVLLSYLFPSISMITYIQLASIAMTILSIILFYHFIRTKYDSNISFLATLVFIGASPITFHSHRHLMFVNYMPFLILALIGVERYFDKQKSGLLIISVFLLIMCSYFYSVGSLFCITLYAIYYYMKKNKLTFKNFLRAGIKFCLPIITSILMAMIILLPTLYVILTGRNDTNVTIDLTTLLLPGFHSGYVLYGNYGMGLTSIFFIALADHLIRKDKTKRYLAIIFLLIIIFPIFVYVLNGGMYIDAKVLIPFLPLACYMIADTLKELFDNKNCGKIVIVGFIFGILTVIFKQELDMNFFLIDFIIITLTILLFKRKYLFTICLIGLVIFNCYNSNNSDEFVTKASLMSNKKIHETIKNNKIHDRNYRFSDTTDHLYRINKVYNMDQYKTSIYSSTVPLNYQNFYFHTFYNANPNRNLSMMGDNLNIFFQYYMAGRYIAGKKGLVGYEKSKERIYENKDVYPLGYVNHNLMSNKQYSLLSYPDNIEALVKYSIVDKADEVDFNSHMDKLDLQSEVVEKDKVKLKTEKDKKIINSEEDGSLSVKLDNDKYKILLIRFKVLQDQSCSEGDMRITINGVKNILTCHEWKYHNNNFVFNYVISSNEVIDKLDLTFNKGINEIADEEVYGFDYDNLKNLSHDVDKLEIDYDLSKGDRIVGDIDVKEDGYFQMSIPYDEGFKIKVDDKNQPIEKVDTAFIGFKLNKGKHHIEIDYEASMRKVSLVLSGIGMLLLLFQLILEKNKRVKKKV